MGGTEVYGDNVYQGIYWNPTGQAFVLPPLAGVDPDYGALHTKAHGINSQGQLAGAGKEGEPNFYTHAALWPNKDTEAIDLGFLGQGNPLNYSEAYGVRRVTVCFVVVQQLLISKSTLSPALITVKGVPVSSLLNQLPGSSVRLMVSTAPPEACTLLGVTAVSASSASVVTQFNNGKFSLFIAL
jgi:hypothetical protein